MRLGASSTVTGAISRVKSVAAISFEAAGARKDCGACALNLVPAAASPAIFRKSRLTIMKGRIQLSTILPQRRYRNDVTATTHQANLRRAVGAVRGFAAVCPACRP